MTNHKSLRAHSFTKNPKPNWCTKSVLKTSAIAKTKMAAPTDIPVGFLPLVLDFLFDGNDVLMTQERNPIVIRYHRFDTNIFFDTINS